jgi:cell filamentation protein
VEFTLTHPFREGNGRTGRLLANLMVLQARKPLLDFSVIDQTVNQEGFKNYILAIHAGHIGNYNAMQEIFKKILVAST